MEESDLNCEGTSSNVGYVLAVVTVVTVVSADEEEAADVGTDVCAVTVTSSEAVTAADVAQAVSAGAEDVAADAVTFDDVFAAVTVVTVCVAVIEVPDAEAVVLAEVDTEVRTASVDDTAVVEVAAGAVAVTMPELSPVGFAGGLSAFAHMPIPRTAAAPKPIAAERRIMALRRFLSAMIALPRSMMHLAFFSYLSILLPLFHFFL